ncbi:MAG: transglutaminase domain-containing protein [Verrucomicrobia bacterium]|nr:transglutaminase domain-containing protein [Verrucomicrobiota bacterium]
MTGNALLGLVLALWVEAAHWTRLRWDFNDAACIRAWHLCAILIALSMVYVWIDGNPYLMVPRLLGWLPVLLLPLQLVQAFGLRDAIPVRTFSFFTKKQRELNHRHGLEHFAVHFNFGHAYLITVMVAATPLDERPDSWLFLPGLVVLTVWALVGSGRCRLAHVSLWLLVAGGLGMLGQMGLARAYHWLNFGMLKGYEDYLNPSHYRTAIGRLGEIKQSRNILWRVRPAPDNPAPTHLRSACYNRYRGGVWSNVAPPATRPGDSDFKALVPIAASGATPIHPLRAEAGLRTLRPALPRFKLRGAAVANSPLPLPGNAASLRDFEVDSFECNSLGTVRVFPKQAILDGVVTWNDEATPETPPWREVDLDVPANESAALDAVLTELRLARQPTLAAKLEVLRRFFLEFDYTRYNSIKPPAIGPVPGPSAITTFLTTVRRGHCEYFATAAALLLREAGIPTRYAIGYTLMELDAKRGEWVIRGLHGHAWTRVWDASAGVWIDFDPTPPGWLGLETRQGMSLQWLLDGVQRLREDFALWRSRARNRLLISTIMLTVGVTGMGLMVRRLWRSKRTVGSALARRRDAGPGLGTPLHHLEKAAAKYLPPRPPGQPFGHWLAGLRPFLTDPAALDEAIHLHQRLRFDPAPPAPSARLRLTELTQQLAAALKTRRLALFGAKGPAI